MKILKILILFNLFNFLFNQAKSQNTDLFEKNIFIQKSDSLPYRFLTPVNIADSEKVFPLIIFLHGSGERGNDNEKQLIHGGKFFLDTENRKNFPAYVIFPQCPENKRWVEVDWKAATHILPEKPSLPMQLTINLIDSFVKTHPIDKNKIYIIGLSMGGYGTWDIISRFPEKFAAAVPICGGGDEHFASKIKNIPVWAFHGTKDKVVSVKRSRNMINAIRKTGGKPKFTEYPNVGHNAWDFVFEEKNLLKWMFSQKKK